MAPSISSSRWADCYFLKPSIITNSVYKMKNILFVGGSGQLGKKVIDAFSNYNVTNIDYSPHQKAKNILLDSGKDSVSNNKTAIEQVAALNKTFDSIIVTAGGWKIGRGAGRERGLWVERGRGGA